MASFESLPGRTVKWNPDIVTKDQALAALDEAKALVADQCPTNPENCHLKRADNLPHGVAKFACLLALEGKKAKGGPIVVACSGTESAQFAATTILASQTSINRAAAKNAANG